MQQRYNIIYLLHPLFPQSLFPKGNSHDLHLEKWYISTTLLLCEIAYGVLVGEKPMCRWDITGDKIYVQQRNKTKYTA